MACSHGTREYYATHARQYAEWTRSLDLSDLWSRLEKFLPPGARVLDLGCGGGRDLRALCERGFQPIGLDFSPELLSEAQRYVSAPLVCADMRNLPFGSSSFQGVLAVASLLHLDRAEILDALLGVRRVLEPGGVLISSIKPGEGASVSDDGRRFTFFGLDEWGALLQDAGFAVEELVLEGDDVEPPRRPWLVSVARRPQ